MAKREHLKLLYRGHEVWNTWRLKHPKIIPDLGRADLSDGPYDCVNLSGANLRKAKFDGSSFTGANFSGAELDEADFREATFGYTFLLANDLSKAIGLSSAIHEEPSSIGIDTLLLSKGKIPEDFLRGAGVPDAFVQQVKPFGRKIREF